MNKPAQLQCPKCRGEDILCRGKRYALYPVGCLALFALPLAWVHRESAPIDYECQTCGHRFSKRTPCAKIAYASLWAAIVWIIAWVIVVSSR